jgi:hypothetical protein
MSKMGQGLLVGLNGDCLFIAFFGQFSMMPTPFCCKPMVLLMI